MFFPEGLANSSLELDKRFVEKRKKRRADRIFNTSCEHVIVDRIGLMSDFMIETVGSEGENYL